MSSTPDPKRASALSGVTAYSPWGSRSATPKPGDTNNETGGASDVGFGKQRGGDHAVTQRHRLSLRSYPRDCPRLTVQWYHAVDSPKRRPLPSGREPKDVPPPPPPKKYVPFSEGDSRAIEAAFQNLAEEEESVERQQIEKAASSQRGSGEQRPVPLNVTLKGKFKVPVNEDYLFDVDVENRELGPAYWLGPVYDVRRGTWFYSVSAGVSPCDENLATQLEEGYLKIRPWSFPPEEQARSRASSQVRNRPLSESVGADGKAALATPKAVTPKPSSGDPKEPQITENSLASGNAINKSFRLFGAHSNSLVTYQDANTAWLLTDDYLSRMNQVMYERFAGGGHFAGVKLVRGFVDPKKTQKKAVEEPAVKTEKEDPMEGPERVALKRQATQEENFEKRRMRLERQMSALVESVAPEGREKQEKQEAEARKRNEQEMEDDYRDDDGSQQGREIEHLVLVTHGIGQRLGLKIESVNFVHDVNTMRRTLKDVYAESPDLQALNGDIEKDVKNSRVQILPICWRHLLDFPKQSLKHNRQEHDLGDTDMEDEEYPALEDINVEGVPMVRNLITDLALDILLYQSPAYKGHITRIVLEEANRVYKLFKERNPHFNGKISLIGHSLGSAILFDILCKQPYPRTSTRRKHHSSRRQDTSLKLDFPVEDFYALGSPIGLFQMLKGRTIAARSHVLESTVAETPDDEGDLGGDPFKRTDSRTSRRSSSKVRDSLVDITTSSPAAAQIYNIFHPTDPIAYRLEPLITNAMAPMKPQPLPYTKKGIFGTPVGQGLTGIGARVSQSVSGLWSSFSSGIASSLVNRSLGLTAEQAAQMNSAPPPAKTDPVANSPPAVEQDVTDPAVLNDEKKRKLAQAQISPGESGNHPPTLIDADMETLYAGFQRHVNGEQEEGDILGAGRGQTVEEQARRLKREEQKVRALNANGRVDYAIQEGAFDVSLLQSVASHLSYWGDQDVAHFMVSQMLARHRVLRRQEARMLNEHLEK